MQSPRLISGRSRISLDDTQDSPGYTHGGGVGGCLKPNLNFGEFFKKKKKNWRNTLSVGGWGRGGGALPGSANAQVLYIL